tara:strand:- start:255 stop:1901 length:1647 start_codon:yes stop_codon:yes gene_type:complete
MSNLLEYVGGQYYKSMFSNIEPAVKEQLAETVVGFSPFVPFSKQFTLRVAQQTDKTLLVPDDIKKDKAFMEQVALYEEQTDDPRPPNTDASRTVSSYEANPELKKKTDEVGQLLRNASIFAFGESDVKRGNPKYVGEVAFDIIAKDIFDKLPEQAKRDIFDVGLSSEEIQKGFFSESFDIGMRTTESRRKLHTSLLSLQKAGFDQDILRRTGGIEITIAYKKRMQKFYNEFATEGSDASSSFRSGAQKYVDELNNQLQQVQSRFDKLGDVIKKGAANLKKMAGLPGSTGPNTAIYEINQALRRVADMNVETLWKGKDTYLYTVPIKTSNFSGQGVAAIQVANRRDFPNMQFTLLEASVVPTTVAGGLETVLLEQNGDVLGLEEGALNDQFQTYLEGTAGELVAGMFTSTTNGRAFDPSAPIAHSIAPYGVISQIMTNREISEAILQSFEGVKKPMSDRVAKIYSKMVNEANTLSRSWQMHSAQHIWKGNFDEYQFGMADGRAEVWKGSNYWTDRMGEGFVVSPLLGTYKESKTYNFFKDRLTAIGKSR